MYKREKKNQSTQFLGTKGLRGSRCYKKRMEGRVMLYRKKGKDRFGQMFHRREIRRRKAGIGDGVVKKRMKGAEMLGIFMGKERGTHWV